MIAEFAHFYLFGFICVTSGNHLTQAGHIGGRGRGSAPAAALLLPSLAPPVWPLRISRPPPLLGNEARLPPCGHPARVCPGSCPGPWGLPGAGRAERRDARRRVLPWSQGSYRGSIDVTPAGVELRRAGTPREVAAVPLGAAARGYRAPWAGRSLAHPPVPAPGPG